MAVNDFDRSIVELVLRAEKAMTAAQKTLEENFRLLAIRRDILERTVRAFSSIRDEGQRFCESIPARPANGYSAPALSGITFRYNVRGQHDHSSQIQ